MRECARIREGSMFNVTGPTASPGPGTAKRSLALLGYNRYDREDSQGVFKNENRVQMPAYVKYSGTSISVKPPCRYLF
ncbi:hypothetical protein HH1059_20550 [Halorhodospira halochloris]|uniref:Uncharacterized protein n=1 Tax=Halorhodospira halochloris TaxID=1052 RepID=A0A2Z6EZV3_HALHR|nr:hypothetical protein HH1059_20550 [Halorhodospira halochloris]